MPGPTSALTSTRADLADSVEAFDLEMDRAGFVAHRVFPFVEVGAAGGQYGLVPLSDLLQSRSTERAPGAAYGRSTGRFTPQTFATQDYGWEEPVDDREQVMYRSWYNHELVATRRCVDAIMRAAEVRVAALVYSTATWTGSTLTTAITNEWDDLTNATPITDVEAAGVRIFNGTGMWPNALVCNRKVFGNLRACDQVIERIHSYGAGQSTLPSQITAQVVAQALGLDFVFVAGSPYNSANEGATPVVASIWSDEYAMVCRVATTADPREPCIGRTFHWDEDGSQPMGRIEDYRDETARSQIVRARFDVQEKVILAAAGHLLSNITT